MLLRRSDNAGSMHECIRFLELTTDLSFCLSLRENGREGREGGEERGDRRERGRGERERD
eukprot:1394698-Amorphochlora_amoeboformis.AAC.1